MNTRDIINLLWNSSPNKLVGRLRKKVLRTEIREPYERHVWCLSTGRVGSQTIASLGGVAKLVDAKHEPRPLLYGLSASSYAYGVSGDRGKILEEAVCACRNFDLKGECITYLESSPQVTFLAESLKLIYKQSRFIHVIRHPADVVRSGMRRKWYEGNANDRWRIKPLGGESKKNWSNWSVFEKNVWLWAETNRWIAQFMSNLPEGDGITLKSEDMFSASTDAISGLYEMLGVGIPEKKEIERILGKKLNRQKMGEFPSMDEWDSRQRDILNHHAGDLMSQYGYTI